MAGESRRQRSRDPAQPVHRRQHSRRRDDYPERDLAGPLTLDRRSSGQARACVSNYQTIYKVEA